MCGCLRRVGGPETVVVCVVGWVGGLCGLCEWFVWWVGWVVCVGWLVVCVGGVCGGLGGGLCGLCVWVGWWVVWWVGWSLSSAWGWTFTQSMSPVNNGSTQNTPTPNTQD